MNKRKLEINEVKKLALRGKKQKTITTKYEIALSYFKQKDLRNQKVFIIHFQPLIVDLLEQLTNVELAYKLENSIKEEIQPLEVGEDQIKFEGPCLKYISKEFPIKQLMECISIKKDTNNKSVSLEIIKNKLMLFFKHIRGIYPQFCFCVGQKIIVENYDTRTFYEVFKVEWAKLNQRGRMRMIQKIQKLICRSLYFVGALVENNIFFEIDEQETKKKEETTDLGTKSQKKRNVRGITYQVSSTYSFGSTDMLSNFSHKFKSQHGSEQSYYKNGYSQKSEKVIRRQRCVLWQKADIKEMKIKLQIDHSSSQNPENTRFEVDLLSNDVQNILIEQAFKIQKLKDANDRNRFDFQNNPYQYEAYMNMNMNMNYYHPSYTNQFYQQQAQGYQHSYMHPNFVYEDTDLYNSRRSFNANNFVQTRKTQSRLGGNKYS